MKKRVAMTVAVFVLVGVAAFRVFDGWTIIEIASKLHSEWGSTNCGHVTNSTYHGERVPAQAAITCAQHALEHQYAFNVIFTGYGIDEEISDALVGDSKGNAVELFYATGMVTKRNRLLSHHCDLPTRLVIEKDSPYGFPRLHCADWPPKDLN